MKGLLGSLHKREFFSLWNILNLSITFPIGEWLYLFYDFKYVKVDIFLIGELNEIDDIKRKNNHKAMYRGLLSN